MTHIDVESASENANAVTPENRWTISGWSDQKSTKITSHSKPQRLPRRPSFPSRHART